MQQSLLIKMIGALKMTEASDPNLMYLKSDEKEK